jgi:NADH-quinone oxidoreductase subunit G
MTPALPGHLLIDGKSVAIESERNLLELIRKAGIELPTFCYHSELSVYGACRLCLVQVEGRGILPACSTPPETGLSIRTATEEIRQIRRLIVELLLAQHHSQCPTCGKSGGCQLQSLARRLGVDSVRFKPVPRLPTPDRSTPSLVRDTSKCILCGDCVRYCAEVQGIGAIDFAYRGAQSAVVPAFNKPLSDVECVLCGQCAAICPTGALTPRSELPEVWKVLDDPTRHVVVQLAPAVRVALGEQFGLEPGTVTTGQIVAALKALGFAEVYDTAFAADLTVIEEAEEFLKRKGGGGSLPQFSSCCPAWVKFAEQYYPDLLPHLSTCRSPQQMLGSLVKATLPARLKIDRQNLVMVSIMPCTAKKFEARRPEFKTNDQPDVDFVLTTQELARMIEERGLSFTRLEPASMDMPFGFKTGAGVIFGSSGGVSEAVLRYALEKVPGVKGDAIEFQETRGDAERRVVTVACGDQQLTLVIVSGLRKAREVAEEIKSGALKADFIEVMACPGGCVGGAGQPLSRSSEARRKRSRGLYDTDRMLELHKAQDNHLVNRCYQEVLHAPGSHEAHDLLHTVYHSRRRINQENLRLSDSPPIQPVTVRICVGTSCYLRGAQELLRDVNRFVTDRQLAERVDVRATFCLEACDRGPTVRINEKILHRADLGQVIKSIEDILEVLPPLPAGLT